MSEERAKYHAGGEPDRAGSDKNELRIKTAKNEIQEIREHLNTINAAAAVSSLAEAGEQPSSSYKLILSSLGLIAGNLRRIEELLEELRQ